MASTVGEFNEFASKTVLILDAARHNLSVLELYLLMAAICRMGEPTKTVYPKLSHSSSSIRELGPTFRSVFDALTTPEQEHIQFWYKRFLDSLSYGKPDHNALR